MSKTITAYKAFKEDMTCRGFQYEVGKTYEHDGELSMCDSGFHACTVPFDCWAYYDTTTFARVTLKDVSKKTSDDSKRVCAKITIDAQLTMPDWIAAQVAAVAGLCKKAKNKVTTGNYAHAASTGEGAHAASTGYRAHAASTGYRAHAASTGDRAHAASTGEGAHAASTGYRAHAASTGDGAHAASTGDRAHAASTGYRAHAASTGYRAHAASTGYRAHEASTGNGAHAASTGYRAHAASTGDGAHAASTGDRAHAASTGNYAHAASTGKNSISAALGVEGTAKAETGGWVVLAEYDDDFNLIAVKSQKVGCGGIKPGVTYCLENKKFKAVES